MRTTDKGIRARLERIKGFALDMDGTLYLGDRLLPGAVDFVFALRASGHKVLFLTNNSSKTGDMYLEKLHRMGFKPRPEEILTSGDTTADYLLAHYPGEPVYLMGNRALTAEFKRRGIEICQSNARVMVAGFDTELTYEKICILCEGVRNGLPFIATHPDFNCPTEMGMVPDLGSMLAMIEASTGRRPDIILGKPYRGIVDAALGRTCLEPEQMAMVGDRLYTDIRTSVDHGLLSILVLSGETKIEDVKSSPWQPELIFSGVGEMLAYLC